MTSSALPMRNKPSSTNAAPMTIVATMLSSQGISIAINPRAKKARDLRTESVALGNPIAASEINRAMPKMTKPMPIISVVTIISLSNRDRCLMKMRLTSKLRAEAAMKTHQYARSALDPRSRSVNRIMNFPYLLRSANEAMSETTVFCK